MASERFNTELQTKKIKDPKEYWNLLESFDQYHVKIPIAKSVLFDHFKTLNGATSPHHNSHEYPSCETIVNPNINENFSVDEVTTCLKKMRNGKSAGHDDVFPEFLKYAHEKVITLLTRFFNKIFVSDDWALSIFRPLYRKGDKKDPNNYRGISLASCLCKLFTFLITERIGKELENKQILGQEQAGFRKNELLRSCLCPICYNIDLSSRKEKNLWDFCWL